jgi:hypothetical protein
MLRLDEGSRPAVTSSASSFVTLTKSISVRGSFPNRGKSSASIDTLY